MKAVLLVLLFLAADVRARQFAGETPPQDIDGWVESSSPDDWPHPLTMCANHGFGGEWQVALVDGRVTIREYEPGVVSASPLPEAAYADLGEGARGARSYLPVEDGYLVGFNAGEWGGSVWWLSTDGSSHYRLGESSVAGGNPVSFFRVGEEALLVSGLAHLSFRVGSIKHIGRRDGQWRIIREVPLGTAAEVAIEHPALGIVVIASDGILSYRDGQLTTLTEVGLGSLYPNSIALAPDGSVYVGMRYAVARLNRTSDTVQVAWFVPPTCRTLARSAGSPQCYCKP
ncbi:MAG: hypothetical protein KDI51_17645 [Xanthomonadales bacterium]|nr:hypothetical protein [Xanthomonadales bacterium]